MFIERGDEERIRRERKSIFKLESKISEMLTIGESYTLFLYTVEYSYKNYLMHEQNLRDNNRN